MQKKLCFKKLPENGKDRGIWKRDILHENGVFRAKGTRKKAIYTIM